MKKKICSWEKEVIDSLKAGEVKTEIKNHICECRECEEAVSVYKWLNQLKNTSWEAVVAEKKLLHPETIWKRAFPVTKSYKDLVKKAMRPLIISRKLAYSITTAGTILLLFSNRQEIKHLIESNFRFDLVLIFVIPMAMVLLSMTFCILVNLFEKRKRNQLSL